MRVFSIFKSLSGEINIWPQGTPVTFIRLAGCNLRCSYCDTAKSQPADSGRKMSIGEIIEQARILDCGRIIVTGGEPLNQHDIPALLAELGRNGFGVAVETNGSIEVDKVVKRWANGWVIDIKLPSSGMANQMLDPAKYADESFIIKFVCQDYFDFETAVSWMRDILPAKPTFAFSPAGQLSPAELWIWMQEVEILKDAVLSWQIHKQIWPDSDVER